jgi:glycosyltransferase involved in cell wall biosynthesis
VPLSRKRGKGLRIAFVIDRIYPFSAGGAEKRYWEIARRLQKKHEIHFFTVENRNDNYPQVIDFDPENDGCLTHYITQVPSVYDGQGRRKISSALKFSANIIPSLAAYKFDVIDTSIAPVLHLYPLKMASSYTRSPLVCTVHEVWSDMWSGYFNNRFMSNSAKFLEWMAIRLAKKIIVVSKTSAIRCMQLNLPKEKIAIIPNGIDARCIGEVKPDSENHDSDIAFVGRLVPHKGVEFLLKATKILKANFRKDIRVNIIGQGPLKEHLMLLTRELGLKSNVRLLDDLDDHQEVMSYLKSSKLFVLPSFMEGFSIATIEAMACGLPVITFDVESNAAREHVTDFVNGFKVKPNVDDLASSIMSLLTDPALREKMGRNARNYSAKYDWDRVIPMLEKVYATVASKN